MICRGLSVLLHLLVLVRMGKGILRVPKCITSRFCALGKTLVRDVHMLNPRQNPAWIGDGMSP